MNYKLTLAIFRDTTCLGGLKVTVYKPLPHMEQGLTVTSWGKDVLTCDDIANLMEVEENALDVEEDIREEREGVEPDAR